MNRTARENQRSDFVDSLYKSIKIKTEIAINRHAKLCVLAATHLQDGLEPDECVELLIIDGKISRNAAKAYVDLAKSEIETSIEDENNHEYSFQFEDIHGRIWGSYDVGKVVKASSAEEAWEKAEELIFTDLAVEPEKVISVDRIS